ncbi:MAG: O-antigen ligase family protein [Pseudomonadota bacterium]
MPLFVLFVWPLVALALIRRQGRAKGVIWALLIGALFLPEAYSFDLPGLPPLDKEMSVLIGLLLGLWLTRKKSTDEDAVGSGGDRFARAITVYMPVLVLLSAVLTVLNNTEPVIDGPVTLQGLTIRDMMTMLARSALLVGPYIIAQRYLSKPEDHLLLLRAFVIMGFVYSLLVLFEVRMSPQLHIWTYGYFQHSWGQHLRGGAFRPIVFLKHGLVVGMLLMTCAMAAFILLRGNLNQKSSRTFYLFAGLWFMIVLALSRNFGATILAFGFIPLLWFLSAQIQVRIAAGLMSFFLIFPALRQTEVITFERFVDVVGQISTDRQGSFMHRLNNEKRFLERLSEKPVTGWGIWGRWRVRDAETGEDISTSDSRWASILGERGWFGFLTYFGLMIAPVILLLRTLRRRQVPMETAGIAMILCAITLYQINTNSIGALSTVFAGALAGFVWRPAKPAQVATIDAGDPPPARPIAYSRFPVKSTPKRSGPLHRRRRGET